MTKTVHVGSCWEFKKLPLWSLSFLWNAFASSIVVSVNNISWAGILRTVSSCIIFSQIWHSVTLGLALCFLAQIAQNRSLFTHLPLLRVSHCSCSCFLLRQCDLSFRDGSAGDDVGRAVLALHFSSCWGSRFALSKYLFIKWQRRIYG